MMQNQNPEASARWYLEEKEQNNQNKQANCLCRAMQLQCWGKQSDYPNLETIAITKRGNVKVCMNDQPFPLGSSK